VAILEPLQMCGLVCGLYNLNTTTPGDRTIM
jgi:hypothetical protein